MKTFIAWLAMVFLITVYPVGKSPVDAAYADKLLHAAIYAITCALFYAGLKGKKGMAGRWPLALSVLLATAYGFLMELAQNYTGYRSYSNMDVLANFVGALAAAVYIKTMKKPAQRA